MCTVGTTGGPCGPNFQPYLPLWLQPEGNFEKQNNYKTQQGVDM